MFNKSSKSNHDTDAMSDNMPPPIPSPSKPSTSPAPSQQPVATKQPSAASVISADMSMKGSVISNGDVHIDGIVEGDVRAQKLIIGDTAQVFGEVTAEMIEVRGKVVGSLQSRKVHLYANAYVEGDIVTAVFAVESGAFFDGRCKHEQDPIKGLMGTSHDTLASADMPPLQFSSNSAKPKTAAEPSKEAVKEEVVA